MVQYIFQVVSFQLLFLIVFELFLKKETFFSYNRVYLLVSPVLAMLLPLLEVPMLQSVFPAEGLVILPEVFIGNNNAPLNAQAQASTAVEGAQFLNWWLFAYGAGMLFSLGLFFNKFRVLKQLFSYRPVLQDQEMRIVEVPQSKIACTFFNTIFLGKELSEKERTQILSHEMVHLRQRHTLDLLFFEFLKIILWFNPLIYIYQSRISACHEFLADAGVVKTVETKTYFEQLLNSAFNTEDISFINQFFNQTLIKKRIVMLQRSRSSSARKFKFLIVLPLMLAMLTYVSCSEESAVPKEKEAAAKEEHLSLDEVVVSEKKKENLLNSGKSPSGTGDVPFTLIEQVPVFPGCETLGPDEDLRKCMTEKITYFVNKNFDTSLGKALNLTGINKIYVQFKINKEGVVEVLGVRAPHPALEEEAERVVKLLPQMTPGKHRGEEVGVLYSLPITFMVAE